MSDYVNQQIDEMEFNKLKPQMIHLIATGDERWLHDIGYDRVERLLKTTENSFRKICLMFSLSLFPE